VPGRRRKMRTDSKGISTAVAIIATAVILVTAVGIYYVVSHNGDDDFVIEDEINTGVGTHFDYNVSGIMSGKTLSGTYVMEIVGISSENALRYVTYDIFIGEGSGKTPLNQSSEYDLMTPEVADGMDYKRTRTATLDTMDGKQKLNVYRSEESGAVSEMFVGSNGVPYRQTQGNASQGIDMVLDLSGYELVGAEVKDDPSPVGNALEYSISVEDGGNIYEGSMSLGYVAYDDTGYWMMEYVTITGTSSVDYTHHDWSEGNDSGIYYTGAKEKIQTMDGELITSVLRDRDGSTIYADQASGIMYRMIVFYDGVKMTYDLTYYKVGDESGGSQGGGGPGLE
jgi:hypothetical protein